MRTAEANRQDYIPTDGLAVNYRWDDKWELALPDDTKLDLGKKRDPALLTPAERKLDKDARAAVRERIAQYLRPKRAR